MKKTAQILFVCVLTFLIAQSVQSQTRTTNGNVNKSVPIKPSLTAEQIAQRFLPGVALIICDDGKGNFSQGSGFFIAPGMILTNAHVVKGMVRGVVMAGGQKKKNHINAIAYFNSDDTDLALLVSDEAKTTKTPILPMAKSNDLRIGETIYVLSNPEGLVGTISQGIVSSGIRKMNNKDLLQISAPISGGSSGGAVVNSRGEVIGIATASLQSGQNLNFAVPAARIEKFLDEFMTLPSPPEYIVISKFSGSWIAPESFLNESKARNEIKISPSSPSGITKPTIQETASWLISRVIKLNGYFYDNRIEYKNVSFTQCQMYYNEVQYGPKGEAWKFTKYSADLRFADGVVIGPVDQKNPLVMINFDKPGRIFEKRYALEDDATTALQMENGFNKAFGDSTALVFFSGDREESKRLQTAFNYIIELCKSAK